jgi:3'-phosphoadenosine 5'-phosphosulfate sulfotransferase (PAPS reductase)/FAD synthetase
VKYQISFSGGLGSAISALVAYENNLDFNLIFADTLIEDEDLYRFLKEVAGVCGKPLIWLVDGRTPWDVFVDKRWIGNTRTAHCSTELKTKQVMKWLDTNADIEDPLVLGMDWSEIDRIERAQKVWTPRPVISILNEFKITRPMYADILAKYDIPQPRLYDMGFSHNNCGGFCCKAGQKQFANLKEKMPERFAHHAQEMEDAMEDIGPTARPFLRKTIDSELQYLTLKDYGKLLDEDKIEVPEFDSEGCGCFTDE